MPRFKTLMPIRTKGSKLPLFCVHGQPLRMAQNLPDDQPIYGLSHVYHSDFLDEPPKSIEQISTTYLNEIRQVQPTGPYHFLGFSAGGLISFEMARQLLAAGETVGNLTLVEPTVTKMPSAIAIQQRALPNKKRTFWGLIQNLAHRAPKSLLARTRYYSLILAAKIFILYRKPLPETLRWIGYLRSLGPAMKKYEYEPIECKATLLYQNMSEAEYKNACKFWDHLFTQGAHIEVFSEAQTHSDFMLAPSLKKTAELIESHLAKL
jgi:thioesterase domain-containing protein